MHDHPHTRSQATGSVKDVPEKLGRKVLNRISAELLQKIGSETDTKIERVQIELIGEPQSNTIARNSV